MVNQYLPPVAGQGGAGGRVAWDRTGAEAGRWWPEPAESCHSVVTLAASSIATLPQHTCITQSSLKPSLGKIFLSKHQQRFQKMHGFFKKTYAVKTHSTMLLHHSAFTVH